METTNSAIAGFDFDEWAKLARENPEEFERWRRAAIEALIASSPERRRRLEGTQWRLDRERELAHTPLKACLRMSAMMWDSFLEMKSGLDDIAASASAVTDSSARARHLELVGASATARPDASTKEPVAAIPAPASARILAFARRETADDRD